MRFSMIPGLRSTIVGFCLVFMIIGGIVLAVVTAGVSREVTARQSTAVLRSLGDEVSAQLVRFLAERWTEVEGLVRFAQDTSDPAALRSRLETVTRLNDRYVWIGLARPDGRVAAASERLL